MLDGKNVRFVGEILKSTFRVDKYGSYIPIEDQLRGEKVAERVSRLLRSNTGLWKRMTDMYYNTDVSFTDNPEGNTPVIGAGVKLFGPRPTDGLKFRGRLDPDWQLKGEVGAKLEKRAGQIREFGLEGYKYWEKLEPADKLSKEHIIWQVEGDQVLTGGGFDNNKIGEVQKSALNFITKATQPIEYEDSELSKMVVEESLNLRDYLVSQGLRLGQLEPDGATKVRFEQDKDGMIGFPVFGPANAELTHDIAMRLLLWTGIDTRDHIGSTVVDKHSSVEYKYRNIDALAYILDNSSFNVYDVPSIVVLLARIQKHGWILKDDGTLEAKPGKTRSVYPNSAIAGMTEAMIASPFLRELQERKVEIMPSLQNKEVRVDMITKLLKDMILKDYDLLAADWSQYDATVQGSILATIMVHAVKPFYNVKYHEWFDRAVYNLTFKHIVMDGSLAKLYPEERQEAIDACEFNELYRPFELYSLTSGLISGAKFTHVGGSLYGEVVIHRVIPRLLGYEPVWGPQAGDDTLMGIPLSYISDVMEDTYLPIKEAAAKVGLDLNEGKQIWHQSHGEIVKVFLQEIYHYKTDTWGIGSIFRPYSAFPFAERNKGLSISEQMIAIISRANGGYDNPFVVPVLRDLWLPKEQFLGVLFKEHGISAFKLLTESIGLEMEELAQALDVGSFSWGVSRDQLATGDLPILPALAEAAAELKLNVSISEVIKTLNIKEQGDQQIDDPTVDIYDSEDGYADH